MGVAAGTAVGFTNGILAGKRTGFCAVGCGVGVASEQAVIAIRIVRIEASRSFCTVSPSSRGVLGRIDNWSNFVTESKA